jgi:hypothetical protein
VVVVAYLRDTPCIAQTAVWVCCVLLQGG